MFHTQFWWRWSEGSEGKRILHQNEMYKITLYDSTFKLTLNLEIIWTIKPIILIQVKHFVPVTQVFYDVILDPWYTKENIIVTSNQTGYQLCLEARSKSFPMHSAKVLSLLYEFSFVMFSNGGVARTFPGGRPAHLEPQIEEENGEKLRKLKMRENLGEWGKVEEMLLSCPPGVESLTTPLFSKINLT